jgi:YggT family protein
MPIIGYFFLAISNVLVVVLNLFMIMIIARAVLSWVSPDPYNPIVRFIHNVTEPVLYPIRQKVPINFGGIDFSPIIVLLAIIFLKTFLVQSFEFLGRSLI